MTCNCETKREFVLYAETHGYECKCGKLHEGQWAATPQTTPVRTPVSPLLTTIPTFDGHNIDRWGPPASPDDHNIDWWRSPASPTALDRFHAQLTEKLLAGRLSSLCFTSVRNHVGLGAVGDNLIPIQGPSGAVWVGASNDLDDDQFIFC
jgi:hypothetical protein